MATLSRELRKALERVVLKARGEAEAGARKALEQLAVAHRDPWHTMTPEQQGLRRRLRARGRQLGDRLEDGGKQGVEHLLSECAYEQWHRMLFARFLAECELLIEPESGVSVSVDECKELARDRSVDWISLASTFAQRMLPQIFRADDPVLEIVLPAEHRQPIEQLLVSLPPDLFLADDSLGWVYQFWQSEEKVNVNRSGEKIGAGELPAVTQLFTEDYMVNFLLDNTLGAWHFAKVSAETPSLRDAAQDEDALRRAAALPGCPWTYLRFAMSSDGRWIPAAGTFDGWPKTARALKCLDPCMGSGHFVVAMFQRLVALRIAEERLDETAAVVAVIRDNLFGLEIDPRCTQIGAFNLALAAWRRVGHRKLPAMNLACSGIAPNAPEADWLAVAADDEHLRNGMTRLYRLFKDAPVLGSLINPRAGEGDLLEAAFHQLQPLLERALDQESKDDMTHEMAVTAHGLAKAAEVLAGEFTLVATNVPYLGTNDQDPWLKDLLAVAFPLGRSDLATCFLERCLDFCSTEGTAALVSPQSWLFIGPYRRLREHLLKSTSFRFVAQLGKRAFETIGGEVVNVNLTAISKWRPLPESTFASIDVSALLPLGVKASALRTQTVDLLLQSRQLENPDARVIAEADRSTVLLSSLANSHKGIATGDLERFIHYFWEHSPLAHVWSPLQGRVDAPALYGGREQVVLWENGRGQLHAFVSERLGPDSVGAWLRGDEAWLHRGVAIGQMTSLPCTIYLGDLFDENTAAVIPSDESDLPALWTYCQSQQYRDEVKKLDNSSLKIPNLTLIKVPVDLSLWREKAAKTYPEGLPKPFSSDPTQWLFDGNPKGSDRPLHVAVARLLGYEWPRQTGSSFMDCPALGPDGLEAHADADGIVCLSATKGEAPASERLRGLLASAWKTDWNATVLENLLAREGYSGKTLDEWLLNAFFEQHCELFKQRPFIWHVWDGRRDGFSALVNYHRLTLPTLEKLTYAYLGDWIGRQQAAVIAGDSGSETRLVAATQLQQELKKIIEGEPPYDIFVRWKPLAHQPLGWAPDLNDGVRTAIRPFLLAADAGKKAAGILRGKPGIRWEKDRGKEPPRSKEEFPWFWGAGSDARDFGGGTAFDGNRWNSVHYSRRFKLAARTRKGL